MKIISHRISIQTLLFQACLPTRQNGVENRDKAYFTTCLFLLVFHIRYQYKQFGEFYCQLHIRELAFEGRMAVKSTEEDFKRNWGEKSFSYYGLIWIKKDLA